MSTSTSKLGSILRNPMVVFGLILLAGDSPLVVAFGLADTGEWVRGFFAVSLVGLIAAVLAALILFLVFSPRRLYAPGEIPPESIDKRLFSEGPSMNVVTESMESLIQRAVEKTLDAPAIKAKLQPAEIEVIREEAKASTEGITPKDLVITLTLLDKLENADLVGEELFLGRLAGILSKQLNVTPKEVLKAFNLLEKAGRVTITRDVLKGDSFCVLNTKPPYDDLADLVMAA